MGKKTKYYNKKYPFGPYMANGKDSRSYEPATTDKDQIYIFLTVSCNVTSVC